MTRAAWLGRTLSINVNGSDSLAPGVRPGYSVWGGLEPPSSRVRERESMLGSAGRAPNGSPEGTAPTVGGQGAEPPEAESSVAFEGPAEEPNLTLFLLYRNINVHITEIWWG